MNQKSQKLTNREVVKFLKKESIKTGLIDTLKIIYRPYICPFVEILSKIEENSKVYDIGCGSGQLALLIAQYCNPKEIKGIEISKRLVENAIDLFRMNQRNIKFDFSTYNGTSLPQEISEFDYITMVDVLHHIPKELQVGFLDQLCNLVSTNKKIIFKDIESKSPLVYFNKLHDLVFSGEIGNEVSSKVVENIFTKNGYKVDSFEKINTFVYPHYLFVFEKLA